MTIVGQGIPWKRAATPNLAQLPGVPRFAADFPIDSLTLLHA